MFCRCLHPSQFGQVVDKKVTWSHLGGKLCRHLAYWIVKKPAVCHSTDFFLILLLTIFNHFKPCKMDLVHYRDPERRFNPVIRVIGKIFGYCQTLSDYFISHLGPASLVTNTHTWMASYTIFFTTFFIYRNVSFSCPCWIFFFCGLSSPFQTQWKYFCAHPVH